MRSRVFATSVWLLSSGALALSGCGAQRFDVERPNWSLADKPPTQLGAPQPSGASANPPAPNPYEYRGGRDPVTGRADTARGIIQPSRTTPGSPAQSELGPRTIAVQKGDTLHGLSLTHNVSLKALMAANNLTTPIIRPGQKLILPAG